MYQITGIRIPFVNMIDVQLTVNFNLLYACIQTIDIMRKSIYLFYLLTLHVFIERGSMEISLIYCYKYFVILKKFKHFTYLPVFFPKFQNTTRDSKMRKIC